VTPTRDGLDTVTALASFTRSLIGLAIKEEETEVGKEEGGGSHAPLLPLPVLRLTPLENGLEEETGFLAHLAVAFRCKGLVLPSPYRPSCLSTLGALNALHREMDHHAFWPFNS